MTTVAIASIFLLTPMVTYTFDLFKGEGMIFHFWQKFLLKYESQSWTKPLGLCANCTNVWMNIFLITTYFINPIIPFTIIGFSVSNYLLKLIYL